VKKVMHFKIMAFVLLALPFKTVLFGMQKESVMKLEKQLYDPRNLPLSMVKRVDFEYYTSGSYFYHNKINSDISTMVDETRESAFFKFPFYFWSYQKLDPDYKGWIYALRCFFVHSDTLNDVCLLAGNRVFWKGPGRAFYHRIANKQADFFEKFAKIEKFKKVPKKGFIDFLKNIKDYLTEENFQELKKEVVESFALTYKIHLQVKPEYLRSFVDDFMNFFLKEEDISSFKVAADPYDELVQKKESPAPTIVVYLMLLPKDKAAVAVTSVLQRMLARYKGEIAKKIDLGSHPRSNRQVRDFIHVAGGGGYEKEIYKKISKKNTVYTDDYAFFKGYDIDVASLVRKRKRPIKREDFSKRRKIERFGT